MTESILIREGTFIQDPEGGRLVGNRCKSCEQIFFPKVQPCLNCFHKELEEVLLSRKGRLYSYTTAYMPASGLQPPYAVGYIDLPEGIRVFAPLKEVEAKPLQVGMPMDLVIERLWTQGGKEVIGYKFTPA